jgi:hypothetical protein
VRQKQEIRRSTEPRSSKFISARGLCDDRGQKPSDRRKRNSDDASDDAIEFNMDDVIELAAALKPKVDQLLEASRKEEERRR